MSLHGFYTTKGAALTAKLAAGTKLSITKVVAGSGSTTASALALANIKQTLAAGTAKVDGQTAVLPVTLAEADVDSSYSLKELGVYATDPDEGEILFQVFQLSEGHTITAGGESVYRFFLKTTVGERGITVVCSPSGLLTEEDLESVYAEIAGVLVTTQSDMTLHVAKTGSDETGDGSESAPYLTVQKAVDTVPKLLMGSVTILVHAGTYAENVALRRFGGAGALSLVGATNEKVKLSTVEVVQCMLNDIRLDNLELTGTNDNGSAGDGWSLLCSFSSRIRMYNIICTGKVSYSWCGAMRFDHVPEVWGYTVTISNKSIALDVSGSVVYLNSSVTGTGNSVGIRSGSGYGMAGGIVIKGGASIAGSEQKGYGGQIW